MMQRKVFDSVGEAEVFASERGVRASFAGDCWEVGWDDEVPFDPEKHTVAFERIVSRNGGEGSVDAPAEIVQRLKVKTIGQYTAFDFHVDLCEVKKPHRMVSFRVTKDDADRFKVGSEIEVVLRPAPLA